MKLALTFGSVFTAVLLATLSGCSTTSSTKGAEGSSVSDIGARAADPTAMGPAETTSSEYKLPAATNEDILPDRMPSCFGGAQSGRIISAMSRQCSIGRTS